MTSSRELLQNEPPPHPFLPSILPLLDYTHPGDGSYCVSSAYTLMKARRYSEFRFGLSGSAADLWCTFTRGVLHGDSDGITREVRRGVLQAEGI